MNSMQVFVHHNCIRASRFISFQSHQLQRGLTVLVLVMFALSLAVPAAASGSSDALLQGAQALQVVKTSSAGGGVHPGDLVTYTVAVTNTSMVPQNHLAVTDTLPAGTTYVPNSTRAVYPGPASTATYLDQFTLTAYNNTNGTAPWTSSWVEGGYETGNDPTTGAIFVTNSGKLRMSGSYDLSTFTRAASMAAASTATLSFIYAVANPIGLGDIFTVSISPDGGTSWTVLDSWDGNLPATGTYSRDISLYANANTQIRFSAIGFTQGADADKRERVELDNVQIQFVTPGASLTRDNITGGTDPDLAAGTPPSLVTALDGIGLLRGSTLTVTYQVLINNPLAAGILSFTNQAAATSDEQTTPAAAAAADILLYPGLVLDKTAAPSTATVDDAITYSFAATNTGTETLTGLTITDSLPGLSGITCASTTLAPGASVTCTATYTVTIDDAIAGTLSNSATAEAQVHVNESIQASDTLILTINDPLPPTADDESVLGVFNIPASLGNITSGDVAHGTGNAILTSTIDIDPSLAGNQSTFTGGGHTWTANTTTGVVTFTPADNFISSVTIPYSVEDRTGQEATANLTVSVAAPAAPTAQADGTTTPYYTPVTLANITANDAAAGQNNSLVLATIDLAPFTPGNQAAYTDASGNLWEADTATGEVTFTPVEHFMSAALIPYSIEDELGQEGGATLAVLVANPAVPAAGDDSTTTTLNDPATLPDITGNDVPYGRDNSLVIATIDLDDATVGNQSGFTDADGNLWQTTATPGEVRFTPAENFTGPASIDYSVEDELGQEAVAVLTVTVSMPNAPAASNDSTSTDFNVPATLADITANDTAYGTGNSILRATLDLDISTPGSQSTTTSGGHTWTADLDTGSVSFTPAENFVGTATLDYSVADELGQQDTAQLSITVAAPAQPTAADDSTTTDYYTPAVLADITANDAPHGLRNSLVIASLDLDAVTPGNQPSFTDADGNQWQTTATPGEVSFTPAEHVVGPASIAYSIEDEIGQEGSAALSVTVSEPAVPTADDETAATGFNMPATLGNVTDGDAAFGTGNSIVISSLDLDAAAAGNQPSFTDADGNLWEANLLSGEVTFTPAAYFVDDAVIQYVVEDELGRDATASLTVTVSRPALPAADDESATTDFNTPVTLGNVTDGDTAYGAGNSIILSSLDLDPLTAGNQAANTDAAGNLWEADLLTGVVTFTPAENFVGNAALTYSVEDGPGQEATATLTVLVNPPAAPTADDESAAGAFNLPVLLGNVTDGDAAFGERNSIVAASLDLDPAVAGNQAVYTDGSGQWTAAPTGEVTFTPANNFVGTDTIPYTVEDEIGQEAGANLTATVNQPSVPTADAESATTAFNTPASLGNITLGDTAFGQGNSIVTASIDLNPAIAGNQAAFSGAGHTWAASTTSGVVTFTPANNFVGTVSIPYTVEDEIGQEATASLSVTVTAPGSPTALDNSGTTLINTAAALANITANDTASGAGNTIVIASIDLNPTAAGNQPAFSGAGHTWTANTTTGVVTFTPANNFVGVVSIPYSVEDELGREAAAHLTVTVVQPALPTVQDDTAETTLGSPVTFANITANDTAHGAGNSIVRSTLDLDEAAAGNQAAFTDADGNQWAANTTTGSVIFTPTAAFSGVASITYSVADELGQRASASLSVAVDASLHLTYFRAVRVSASEVTVQWATQDEWNTKGYRLLRAASPDLTQAVEVGFVPADPQGMTYEFADSSVPGEGEYWYWVVKVYISDSEVTSSPTTVDTTNPILQFFMPIVMR